ncbi:hypothetical protein Tsubulata_043673, partial [Turnera subulata]
RNIAVKVFDLQLHEAFRSFDTECEILRNIRHRNLVKIICSCSNPEFKALVLHYMPNGSLLNIMIDVASALEYLHHGNPTCVVHCDLKPSNVLLDNDMVAHVCDFGIGKLLGESEPSVQTKTLATIGYMASSNIFYSCLRFFFDEFFHVYIESSMALDHSLVAVFRHYSIGAKSGTYPV